MNRKTLTCCITIALIEAGCTAPLPETRVITPPAVLTQPVPKPEKPNPKTATQKDVAVYLVELNGAFNLANFKLQLIDEWSKQNHEKTNTFRLREPY